MKSQSIDTNTQIYGIIFHLYVNFFLAKIVHIGMKGICVKKDHNGGCKVVLAKNIGDAPAGFFLLINGMTANM